MQVVRYLFIYPRDISHALAATKYVGTVRTV